MTAARAFTIDPTLTPSGPPTLGPDGWDVPPPPDLEAAAKAAGSSEFSFVAHPDPAGRAGFLLLEDLDPSASDKVGAAYLAEILAYVRDEAAAVADQAASDVDHVAGKVDELAGTHDERREVLAAAAEALERYNGADPEEEKALLRRVRGATQDVTIAGLDAVLGRDAQAKLLESVQMIHTAAAARRDQAIADLATLEAL